MRSISALLTTMACLIPIAPMGLAASNNARDDARGMVSELAGEIRNNYVFPDMGERAADHLMERAREGAYDGIDEQHLANTLTQDLQEFTHDLHFLVQPLPEGWAPRAEVVEDGLDDVDDEDDNLDGGPAFNSSPNGFSRVERLGGNIGYLQLTGFEPPHSARDNANAAMQLLAGSSALIVDLRRNGGGAPEMVQLLTSYLFDPDEPVHLNSLYFRPSDSTTEYWTNSDINTNNAMPDVPVYVLTSAFTFSAAEEFSYNLQSRKRAVIVGENTGGGAHPVNRFIISDRLAVSIPVGRAINPITGTNWEGTGVKPDIEVPAPEAMDTAIREILTGMVAQGDEQARWGLVSLIARTDPVPVSEAAMREYAGQYTDRELMVEDGELMYRRKGRPSWSRLIGVGEDEFVIDGYEGFLMRFDRDSNGRITRIIGNYPQRPSDSSDRE